MAKCNVLICNARSAEVTFLNAGKVSFIIFDRLLFFLNTIYDGLKPLWFINDFLHLCPS